ncbi:MAG: hypothetical protein R2865_07790 [Deinococcales bacterium]
MVISATENDPSLAAIDFILSQIGLPFDRFIASREDLNSHKLISASGDGRYQGIILTDGALIYRDGQGYISAFSSEEWNLLWQYAREFQVRQLSLFSYPGSFPEDLGLRFVGAKSPSGEAPLWLEPTPQGQQLLSSLKANIRIPVEYAYSYLSRIEKPELSQPLLKDDEGHVLAALSKAPDGREILSLTMAHNPFLEHSLLLGYDLLRWVTQGVFIGQRQLYLHLDIDDWYQATLEWNPATLSNYPEQEKVFRISGSDVLDMATQLDDLKQSFPVAKDLIYNIAFVTEHADINAKKDCNPATASLSAATLCVKDDFYWLNHSYTELVMSDVDYQTAFFEINENLDVARFLGLHAQPSTLVTSAHSGLGHMPDETGQWWDYGLERSNPQFLKAAYDAGVRYIASNNSVPSHMGICSICGRPHPINMNLMLIPRYPTSIFFNTTTPSATGERI